MRDWTCGQCQTRNAGGARTCEVCGTPGAGTPTGVSRSGAQWSGPRRCAIDGAELGTGDWCPEGQGYPIAARQDVRHPARRGRDGDTPERFERQAYQAVVPVWACPVCRETMTWDGECDECHGSRTPGDRATWTYPGDRWTLEAGGHYRLTAKGPRSVATEAEATVALAQLRAIGARIVESGSDARLEEAA